ncbi:hypothetical protein BK726_03460 [Bacillus thuringiensis serovar londrina]|nr:hypothetical protein IY08_30135 [Bacillus cereus]KXZ05448.1 hypothetical protein AT281_14995 [Bacillus cereus]OTX93276.1 hypothetical protein BK726_03460 [Bacillus thuringiensis serovar londrina]PEB32936.1 hypothetical protein COM77_28060 [Bacillus cereus]PET55201.1 hypothetical protein CN536_28820 [Bacillus cereus]
MEIDLLIIYCTIVFLQKKVCAETRLLKLQCRELGRELKQGDKKVLENIHVTILSVIGVLMLFCILS